jgi:hypothetical protein
MMNPRILFYATTGFLVGAAGWLPMAAHAQEGTDAAVEAADPALEEERAQVRQELEQRETERTEARQQNCENARAELQRLADLPPRRVTHVNESGEVARMTEEEHAAHIEKLRSAESENCQ